MRFRAATVALLCALSTVDAWPGGARGEKNPVDGTNEKNPPFPKPKPVDKATPMLREGTQEDSSEEDSSEESLSQAAEVRNQELTSLLGTYDQKKDKAAKQVDAPGRDKKAEKLVDLLGISSDKLQSELFTAMDVLASEEQGDETEEDASDEGKEFDGKMKTLNQDISSEEETEKEEETEEEEDSDVAEEELDLKKAENLIAKGEADVDRLRKKLGMSGGEDSIEDDFDEDESGIEDELTEENEDESIEDESLSERVEDLLVELKEEEESFEKMGESDEGDGAMGSSGEELMNKAVNTLRQDMKTKQETGRKNLRQEGKGDSDEDN